MPVYQQLSEFGFSKENMQQIITTSPNLLLPAQKYIQSGFQTSIADLQNYYKSKWNLTNGQITQSFLNNLSIFKQKLSDIDARIAFCSETLGLKKDQMTRLIITVPALFEDDYKINVTGKKYSL